MKVHVTLGPIVRDKMPPVPAGIELPEGSTVSGLVKTLNVPHPEDLMIVRNGKNVRFEEKLTDGDVLTFYYAICGG